MDWGQSVKNANNPIDKLQAMLQELANTNQNINGSSINSSVGTDTLELGRTRDNAVPEEPTGNSSTGELTRLPDIQPTSTGPISEIAVGPRTRDARADLITGDAVPEEPMVD